MGSYCIQVGQFVQSHRDGRWNVVYNKQLSNQIYYNMEFVGRGVLCHEHGKEKGDRL